MNNHHDSFLDALPAGWSSDRFKDVVALRTAALELAGIGEHSPGDAADTPRAR
jgi:hypothetical protein